MSASLSWSPAAFRATLPTVKPPPSSSISAARCQFLRPVTDLCPPFSSRFPTEQNSSLRPGIASERRLLRFGCKSQLGELAPVTSAVYGSLLLGGGLFAFGKSGSKGSLAGGCTGAVLMGIAYYLMQASETQQIGYALGFGSSLLFASVFGIRLAATRKLAPAGPLLGLSVLTLVVFASAYLQGTT
ncbi:hypothetical protein MLD38_016606 [Melastoma candidum]|uniref:Uncharacterized protein n=1 Tax=Melastoma candidum TaxID=119954 RepID=A0ACB9QR17_9MYRT|nr:hypothetical protein MLD38_016606 [Melastoma candidum]